MLGLDPGQQRSMFASSITSFPTLNVYFDSKDADDEENSDDEGLFDTCDFVTVEQDLFLVKYRCFHPEMSMSDLVLHYQREFGCMQDAQTLEDRFQKLQAPEFRALFILYLKTISNDKNSGMFGILPAYHALLNSTRTSCETKLFHLLYADEKYKNEAKDMITVEVSGRSFPKYKRVVSKTQLCHCCKVVQDLYRDPTALMSSSPNRAFTLHAANSPNEKLQFTDTVVYYDNFTVYNHLEQPIFDRLVSFTKDPNMMERLMLLRQQQYEANYIKQDSTQQVRTLLETQRLKHATKLEELRTAEFQTKKNMLEKVLEDDILYLRRMHEALLHHEKAKIDAKYDEQLAHLAAKTEAMQRDVLELQRNCEKNEWSGLERDIMQTSLQVERIFGTSDYLLRLLILAEDLDCELLRRAIIGYLSKKKQFPQYALRRELMSDMISDMTILAIIKGTPTPDLREIEIHGNNFFKNEMVVRELHIRQVALSRFLASLTNDQLRLVRIHLSNPPDIQSSSSNHSKESSQINIKNASDDDGDDAFLEGELHKHIAAITDFPEVLDQEITRRREFSSVKMNSAHVEREVNFSEEDCVLQLEAAQRYCTILATKERKQGESGKWMYEATIELFGGNGDSIFLGWEVPRTMSSLLSLSQLSSLIPGISPSADGKSFGVTWQSDSGLDMGMLHANGVSKSGVPCFRAGDVIGCTINQDTAVPGVQFYLNGDLVLPTDTTKTNTKQTDIAVHNPAYILTPVVSMYSSYQKPQIRVRFNFRGGFRFPILGFEPYGAPLISS